MSYIFKWSFISNDISKKEDNLTYVVKSVKAKRLCEDLDGFYSEYICNIDFSNPDSSNFIDFADINEILMTDWVNQTLGQKAISMIDADLMYATDIKKSENIIKNYPLPF